MDFHAAIDFFFNVPLFIRGYPRAAAARNARELTFLGSAQNVGRNLVLPTEIRQRSRRCGCLPTRLIGASKLYYSTIRS